MPELGVRSTYSQAPFKISLIDFGGEISVGTGFHYLFGGQRYLITNWHNVTGRDFFTRKNLNKGGRTPLFLVAHRARWIGPPSNDARSFQIVPTPVPLYDTPEAQLDRLWAEHPSEDGRGCDIVAIQDEKDENEPEFMHNCVNMIGDQNIPVLPGELAFVVGYPRGLSTGFGLPIWKSTFIASEPYYDVSLAGKSMPALFLDGYTREGMSGSPVFARYRGGWDERSPYDGFNMDSPGFWERDDVYLPGSEGTRFLGIYSGRIPQEQGEAALGLCWRREAIEAVCGNSPC